MTQRVSHVGRYHLADLLEERVGVQVFRGGDEAGLPVQVVLVDAATPDTRAYVTALTRQMRLLEAGDLNGQPYLVLAVAGELTETRFLEENRFLNPPAQTEPTSLWVRVRPFVAAFVLLGAVLVGLHLWDGVGSTHDDGPPPAIIPSNRSGLSGVALNPAVQPTRAAPSPTAAPPTRSAPTAVVIVPTLVLPTAAPPPVEPTASDPPPPPSVVTTEPLPTSRPTAAPPRPTARPATVSKPRVAAPIVPAPAAPVYIAPVVRPPAPRPALPVTRPAPQAPAPPAPAPSPAAASQWTAPTKNTSSWKR